MSLKSLFSTIALFAISAPLPASAQAALRPIMIQNDCGKSVRLWINHADGYRNWHSHGPYDFASYKAAVYLEDRNVRLKQRGDHSLYFYAESLDGAKIWEGGFQTYVNGVDLPMQKAPYSLHYAAYLIRLTC